MKAIIEWAVPASALRFDRYLTTGGLLQCWRNSKGQILRAIWSDGSIW